MCYSEFIVEMNCTCIPFGVHSHVRQLGASPDGIVEDAAQSVKLVEVKFPFRARDKTVEQASMDDRSFCCRLVDNTSCLRPDHDYY